MGVTLRVDGVLLGGTGFGKFIRASNGYQPKNDGGIAEGAVRCPKREGGFLHAMVCNACTMPNAKMKQWVT
jgi:hypothetical protein